MKKIILGCFALLATTFSNNVKAQTDLTINAGASLCGTVHVTVYASTACSPGYVKALTFVVTPSSSNMYNLLDPVYWPGGVLPTPTWTIEEIMVDNGCGNPPGPGGGCTSSLENAMWLNTGIACTVLTPNACYENSAWCSTCPPTSHVNANLSVTATDIILDLY